MFELLIATRPIFVLIRQFLKKAKTKTKKELRTEKLSMKFKTVILYQS